MKRAIMRTPEGWLLEIRLAIKDDRRPTAMNPMDFLILIGPGDWRVAGCTPTG